MDWRKYLYQRMSLDQALLEDIPSDNLHAAGSLQYPPSERPFLVIRTGNEQVSPGNISGTYQNAEIWVHDEPGSYQRIDLILKRLQKLLVGQVVGYENAVAIDWVGDSGELADDLYGTITKVGSYRLVGRRS